MNPNYPTKKAIVHWVSTVLNLPPFPADILLAEQAKLKDHKIPVTNDGSVQTYSWGRDLDKWLEMTDEAKTNYIRALHGGGELTSKVRGLATTGGFNGKHYILWIDFDEKCFINPDKDVPMAERIAQAPDRMREVVQGWLANYPQLQDSPIFSTPHGGLRFVVALECEPDISGKGFTVTPGGKFKQGEALGKGRCTHLPPSMGFNQVPYLFIQNESGDYPLTYPPVFNKYSDLGLYAANLTQGSDKPTTNSYTSSYQPKERTPEDELENARNILTKMTEAANHNPDVVAIASDYATWLNVGMALHSIDHELLSDWVEWSRIAPNFQEGACETKWPSFTTNKQSGVTIGTLVKYAQECGVIPKSQGYAQGYDTFGNNALKHHHNNQSVQRTGYNVLLHPANQILSITEVKSRVKAVCDDDSLSMVDVQLELATIAHLSRMTDYQINQVAKEFNYQTLLDNALKENAKSFIKLVKATTDGLDLHSVLPFNLANALNDLSADLSVKPARTLQVLFPLIGASVGGKIACKIRKSWIEYPTIWTADISGSSTGKSAMREAIMGGVRSRQAEESARMVNIQEKYDTLQSEWDSMPKQEKDAAKGTDADPKTFDKSQLKERVFVLDGGTVQANQRVIATQPSRCGVVMNMDEMSSMFGAMKSDGQTAGGGDAREFYLESWNGPINKVIRRADATKNIRFFGQTLNISGGVQPAIAKNIFQTNSDPDGFMSRVLIVASELSGNDSWNVWNESDVEISEYVGNIQSRIEALAQAAYPEDADTTHSKHKLLVGLSPTAKKTYVDHWVQLRSAQRQYEAEKPGYANFLGKQCGYVARLALVLHLLDWGDSDQPIEAFHMDISKDVMDRAIILSKFYCKQYLLQVAGEQATLAEQLLDIFKFTQKKGGKCTPRMLCLSSTFNRRSYNGKPINSETALKLLTQIANAGYGSMIVQPGARVASLVLSAEYMLGEDLDEVSTKSENTTSKYNTDDPQVDPPKASPPMDLTPVDHVQQKTYDCVEIVSNVIDITDYVEVPVVDSNTHTFNVGVDLPTSNPDVVSISDDQQNITTPQQTRTIETMKVDLNLVDKAGLTDKASALIAKYKAQGARIVSWIKENNTVEHIVTIDLVNKRTEIKCQACIDDKPPTGTYWMNWVYPVIYLHKDCQMAYRDGANIIQ